MAISFSLKEVPLTFLFFLRFYLFVREREHKPGEWQAEGEASSPSSMKPGVGLDPRTPGS